MERALLPWTALVMLSACAGAPPISMTCRPTSSGPATAAMIELRNDTERSITVQGMSVPWLYRHAAHFAAPDFSDPHVLVEPGELETLILLPGESAGGEVPIEGRLLDSFGRSILDLPGTHEVEVRARLMLDPDTAQRRSQDARCRFDLAVEP